MKKILVATFFLVLHVKITAQNQAAAFEKVIREGNSEKAFTFVRNIFGLPALQDPFLHFKERGIRQLISFCSYREQRIEATSLIKFSQTKEFWKNYANQFTAGKWNYRNLYQTDSLAWEAANYSIILIYAHEMGHYMSYRYVNAETSSYTCEEVLANECLAAFANQFNGHKKMDQHKQLFIELCRQTASAIPDSNKTNFSLPLDNWCAPSPMDNFFQYYETDESRFLRLYGYIQFRMMEHLLTTSTQNLAAITDQKFLQFNASRTGKNNFSPLRYRVIKEDIIPKAPSARFLFHKITQESTACYKTIFYTNNVLHLAEDGTIISSEAKKKNVYPKADFNSPEFELERITVWNRTVRNGMLYPLQGLDYLDSVRYTNLYLLSAGKAVNSYWYLMRRISKKYDANIYRKENMNTDSLDKLPEKYTYEFLYMQPKAEDRISYKYFELPDSLTNNDRVYYRDLGLAVYNNAGAMLVNNEYLYNNKQRLTLYPIDTSIMAVGSPVWQNESTDSSFFNIELPSVYIDTGARSVSLAFFNPVTERIYMVSINEKRSKGYFLYNQSLGAAYGPQMKVSALRMIGPRKMYVLAQCRKPGNLSKTEIKRLLIQW